MSDSPISTPQVEPPPAPAAVAPEAPPAAPQSIPLGDLPIVGPDDAEGARR